ncbi:hypothetical protein D3C80_2054170 [compost metagenome]
MRSAPDISTTSSVALRMLAMVSSERRFGLTLVPTTPLAAVRRSTGFTGAVPASGSDFFFVLEAGVGASAFWDAAFGMD